MTDSRMETQAASTRPSGHNGGTPQFDSARKPVVDRLTHSAHETVDKISNVASNAIETLGSKGGQLGDAEKRLIAGTRRYVQHHPVASAGIALVAGYTLLRVFSSR